MRTFLLFCFACAHGVGPCWLCTGSDDALLVYAVSIHRTPIQSWPALAFTLEGLFITAAM